MKEGCIVKLNWLVYRKHLVKLLPLLGVDDPQDVWQKAKATYKAEMERLPDYSKYDVLKLNLAHAVMLGAIYESCETKPTVDQLAKFYHDMVLAPKLVRAAFTKKDMVDAKGMAMKRRQGEKSQKAQHPYTWQYKMTDVGNRRFTLQFTRCGICDYLTSRGLRHIVPAMCVMDYAFGEAGNYLFLRKETLVTGGSMCDCTYIGKDVATAEEKEASRQDYLEEARRGGMHV